MLSKDYALAGEQIEGHPALTDPLTGLANRLHFGLVFRYMFAAGDRGMSFTMMLISCGAETDEQIKAVGAAVNRTTRDSDLVSHVGRGRFVALLLGTNVQGARIAADRVEMALVDVAPGAICFGLAAYDPKMRKPDELLDATDGALLKAEVDGGGVEFATTL